MTASLRGKYFYLPPGLDEDKIRRLSRHKNEPDWMLAFRLRSYRIFKKLSLPAWSPDLSDLNLAEMSYYQEVSGGQVNSWQEIPQEIRETYQKLGLPQAEQKFLAGLSTQAESQLLYNRLHQELVKKGVVFMGIDEALQKEPVLFKKYFASVIPPTDNKFAALNSAVWSGGSFVYLPPGVKVEQPLQAYFLINTSLIGQFERSLIILDEGSQLNYIEGCSAPLYKKSSFHAGVVEVVVKKGAKMRYTTIQNWSKNVFNLTTQRAKVFQNAQMEWIDGNIGSRLTMKYPSCLLMEPGAKGYVLSMSLATSGQNQDTGAKMYHLAPHTYSQIISKSVSRSLGQNSFRGLIYISPQAKQSRASLNCDSLIIDQGGQANTYPKIRVENKDSLLRHEASVSYLDEVKLSYLMSRGIAENEARGLLVNSFLASVVHQIPLEYAQELNKLIRLEMEGSLG